MPGKAQHKISRLIEEVQVWQFDNPNRLVIPVGNYPIPSIIQLGVILGAANDLVGANFGVDSTDAIAIDELLIAK